MPKAMRQGGLPTAGMPSGRFPPPWSVDEANSKLDRRCFIVRDANGQALTYVYFEEEPGRRAAASCSPATVLSIIDRPVH